MRINIIKGIFALFFLLISSSLLVAQFGGNTNTNPNQTGGFGQGTTNADPNPVGGFGAQKEEVFEDDPTPGVPPPPDEPVPLDGGVSILIAAALGLGIKKLHGEIKKV